MTSPATKTPGVKPAAANDPAKAPADAVSNDIPLSLKWELADSDGVPYREFRKRLEPRWGLVWMHIGLAYLVLAGTLAAIVVWNPDGLLGSVASATGALAIGYTIQFLNNFFHESAHYNLLPSRSWNDRVTNLLMGWLYGSSIATYRRTHFQHHRALGTTEDSENSYFDALGMRYLAGGLTGVKVIRSLRRWGQTERRLDAARQKEAHGRVSRLAWIGLGAVVNLGIAGGLLALGSSRAAVAWLVGLLVIFPFLASLRQLLEHRSEEADPEVDYAAVDHGPVNRLFGGGPLASTFGSAGFNRHAIHHWEPQVSFTRLRDIEAYLLRTKAAPAIRERQTSYRDTFLRLLEL
jgi:fatty acid desaturase